MHLKKTKKQLQSKVQHKVYCRVEAAHSRTTGAHSNTLFSSLLRKEESVIGQWNLNAVCKDK
jgi:hypothetical protein